MSEQKPFHSIRYTLVLIQLLISISTLNADEWKAALTQNELLEKYGQANTTYNTGNSCNRVCNGTKMTCYYQFNLQVYDTMNGLCGSCANGMMANCFSNGCVPANGVGKTIYTVNQQMPGPPIQVCQNDRIIVDLYNRISGIDAAIHWHGLFQQKTPWSDGVPMVTQCPTAAGGTYRYKFYATEPGTHFWHAHSGLQRSNGVFGIFNVRVPHDPNADYYDNDLPQTDIVLADWNNLLAEEFAPGPINQAVQPDSLLINGFGSYTNPVTNETTYAPMAVFPAQIGTRCRFRVVNAGTHHCPMEFSVAGYKLTLLATDGFPVEPVVVDSFVLGAGESYDVVINATPVVPGTNYAIITVRSIDTCASIQMQEFAKILFVNTTNYQIQPEDYTPLAERPAYGSVNPGVTLNNPHIDCTNPYGSYCIANLTQKDAEPSVRGNLRNANATVIPLQFSFFVEAARPVNYQSVASLALIAVINNISSVPGPSPGLIEPRSATPTCSAGNIPDSCTSTAPCFCSHMIELEYGETYEFLLLNPGALNGTINHPIHVHGYGYQVIDMGTNAQLASNTTAFRDATYWPVVKDTVIVPSDGFVRIRLKACNAGFWFFHCHFEFHMHIGMNGIMKVGNHTHMRKPPANIPKCGNFLESIYENNDDDWYDESDDEY